MTQTEFKSLEVGDIVYYYRTINITKISHISAALVKKKVGKIFDNEDGTRRIGFEKSGALLVSIIHLFDTDKDKLLYTKLKDMKHKIKLARNGSHILQKLPNGLESRYRDLLNQKNVKPMLKKYPELLI